MSLPTHNTFVYIQNTNEDIFEEIQELSVDSNVTKMFPGPER